MIFVRRVLVFSLCMVAFAVIAASAIEDREDRKEHYVHAATLSVRNGAIESTQQKSSSKSNAELRGDLYRQLESGQRSSEEIQNEIIEMVGYTNGVEFSKENINRAYKLSIIMTHYKSSMGDPYEVLFVHTLADKKSREDTVTFYTRRLDGAEEQNTRGNLVIPRLIEIGDNGQPQFVSASRMHYKFGLEEHPIKRTFDLRDPAGMYQVEAPYEGAFDPLSNLSGGFENPDVRVITRTTDLETLTFEIRLKDKKSLATQTYVLVYEEL